MSPGQTTPKPYGLGGNLRLELRGAGKIAQKKTGVAKAHAEPVEAVRRSEGLRSRAGAGCQCDSSIRMSHGSHLRGFCSRLKRVIAANPGGVGVKCRFLVKGLSLGLIGCPDVLHTAGTRAGSRWRRSPGGVGNAPAHIPVTEGN